MDIFISLSFDAAHRLPNLPAGHKCGNLHGHTFQIEVHLSGETDAHTGWVLDFAEVKRAARPHVDLLDHAYLNDIPGLENPTCENLAQWFWARLKPALPGLARIVVRETPASGAAYAGEGS